MRRTVVLRVALVAFLAMSFGVALHGARTEAAPTTASPPVATQQPVPEKVSYCDRTASVVNPYGLFTSAVDSIVEEGHGSHTGPVFPAVGPDGNWGDIIPPFDYDNGQQHFAGLNWPAGSAVLQAGCAVHETLDSPPVESTTTVTSPSIVVNVSCRATMNLDVTFNEEPPSPWTLLVTTVPTGTAAQPITLVDNDGDLRGFHPKIPADELPQVSYTYSITATNAGQTFTGIASGNVVCQPTAHDHDHDSTDHHDQATTTTTVPPTTTKPPTTTTQPPTTTTSHRPTTSPDNHDQATTTTTRPPTTTTKPPTPRLRRRRRRARQRLQRR